MQRVKPDVEVSASLLDSELLRVLARAMGVCFVKQTTDAAPGLSFALSSPDSRSPTARLELPAGAHRHGQHETVVERASFAEHPAVPWPFRGRSITTSVPAAPRALPLEPGEIVLASCAVGPIWTLRFEGRLSIFRCSLPLPIMFAENGFADVFSGDQFLALLPLVSLLKDVRLAEPDRFPPLRATFIIDDPNLHWPTYGFVDYPRLAEQAERENYHLAFATIPLDAWFTHRATAKLFRRHARRLSLLVHGNNHAKTELARPYTPGTRRALLAQALRRVEKLERTARLAVSRVMVPPHGACSAEMLADMPSVGFESACISTGSLRAHNASRPWARFVGYHPAEVVEDCCVLPRWGLGGNVEASMLLAAYLGKPMILRGHHQDFKDGSGLFDQYAKFINGLGDVQWLNMTQMSRAAYVWRREGTTCVVTPLSPIIDFPVPEGVSAVVLEDEASGSPGAWQARRGDGAVSALRTNEQIPVDGVSPSALRLERVRVNAELDTGERVRSARLIARRLLTEARDRLLSF